jgi:hypothetical protein
MAFCPHCGKSVTDQASKCLSCGKEFEPRAKAARFKGTMMMQPAGGAAPAAPAAPKPAPPAAAAPVAAKAEATPAAAPAAAAAARAAAAAPSKVSKATMLGTGGAGLAPPAARASVEALTAALGRPPSSMGMQAAQAAPAAAPPPPAAKVTDPDLALAQTARLRTEPSLPQPPAHAPAPEAAQQAAPPPRDDSQRFLIGDPMAPTPPTPQREGRARGRLVLDRTNEPSSGVLIGVGVAGMVVIAAVGYFTAHYLGLL